MAMVAIGRNIMVLIKMKTNVLPSSMVEMGEMEIDLIQKKNADGSVKNK